MLHYARKEKSFWDIYPNKLATKMCCGPGDEIVEVDVTIDEAGEYWGWLETGEEIPCFIYPRRLLVDICFPDGIDGATKRGRGTLVRVKVEEK